MRKPLNILARKPRDHSGNEFIVVDLGERGPADGLRYVSATANAISLASGQWFWGHYFGTQDEAMAHFDSHGVLR